MAANIDAYPILLDHKRIVDSKELYQTVKHLSTSYNVIRLVGVDFDRLKGFVKLVMQQPLRSLIITEYLEQAVEGYL